MRRGDRLETRGDAAGQVRQVAWHAHELEPSDLHPRSGQEVIDLDLDALHVAARAHHVASRRRRDHPLVERPLQEADGDAQRRLQLMADVGDEAPPLGVRVAQLVCDFLQLGVVPDRRPFA
jgi:hypothetical protein